MSGYFEIKNLGYHNDRVSLFIRGSYLCLSGRAAEVNRLSVLLSGYVQCQWGI